jgi:SAM-dependent methyltransferase
MRDYLFIDCYLDKLSKDIYDQPEDKGHTKMAKGAIEWLFSHDIEINNVLDVGCGVGFCSDMFTENRVAWTGITMSENDCDTGLSKDYDIHQMDISFLNEYGDNSFDLIFARHILEHSPMPLLTLMEWHRVSSRYLFIVLPTPEYWQRNGRNHYYVLEKLDWKALFGFSNWRLLDEFDMKMSNPLFFGEWLPGYADDVAKLNQLAHEGDKVVEFWFLLEKK